MQSVRPRQSARPSGVVPTAPTLGPHVLVIDDDELVRRALVRVLRRKYTVTELRDAESAVALLDTGKRFDAIICDLNLGGMSGREFLLLIRATHAEQAKRVVILSGNSRSRMDDDFLDVVSSRFLEKPATMTQIDAMLADLVSDHARAA